MTVVGTKAFDIKDALIVTLRTNAALLAIPHFSADNVTYGFMGRPEELPRLAIEVGEIVWDEERAISLGAARRDETFAVALIMHSHVPGDKQEDANARIKALMQAVETAIRPPRWSGISNIISSGFVPSNLAEGTDPEGRGALFFGKVYITARI